MRLSSDIAIPPGWGLAPLKRLTRFGYGEAISADDRDATGTIKVYGSNGAFDQHSAANTLGPCIIVGRKGSYGKCQFSYEPVFAVDTTFIIDRRYTNADLRYLFYLLGALGLDELSDDTAVPGLSREKAYQSLSPLAPLETQKRIADFLDGKTAQIDGLIARKQALLERLAEKRQAIITQAVTKGLNPAAPMKDSGIDWLGQIPAHWEALPLRRLAERVVTGRTPPSAAGDFFTDGEVPWYTPGDFDGLFLADADKALTADAFSEGYAVRYPANSVLLVGIGATLGKVAVASEPCSSNQQINAIMASAETEPVFLAYFLHGFRAEVRMSASGNTLPILNQDKTKAIVVTRPPRPEQEQISAFLREQDKKVQAVVSKIARSVEFLRERRAAIVTNAVTGQIEGLQ